MISPDNITRGRVLHAIARAMKLWKRYERKVDLTTPESSENEYTLYRLARQNAITLAELMGDDDLISESKAMP